jgi:hypothetical protein
VSGAQAAPVERRLRLIDGGGGEPAGRTAVRRAFTFRPRPSNAALALTDDDHAAPPRPRLRLVGDPADAPADPFEVPAERTPLGAGREPVWLEEFLERAADVLRERPRAVQQFRGAAVRDELARIRHLRPVRASSGEVDERGGLDACPVVELHGRPRRRPVSLRRQQC